jgi:hypothetical protein
LDQGVNGIRTSSFGGVGRAPSSCQTEDTYSPTSKHQLTLSIRRLKQEDALNAIQARGQVDTTLRRAWFLISIEENPDANR